MIFKQKQLRHSIIKIFFLLTAITGCSSLLAQQVPLNQLVQNRLNELMFEADSSVFSSFRSMNWLELQQTGAFHKSSVQDSIFGLNTSIKGDIKNTNLVRTSDGRNVFTIDPYIEAGLYESRENISAGRHTNNTLTGFAGGVRLQGAFNNKVSFNVSVISNLNQYPAYVDSVIFAKYDHYDPSSNKYIIPGSNAATLKNNNRFANTNFDFNVTYTPDKHFLVSAGYGKQFIGDGYRSLLLSDNANNYPYLRLQARIWKLTYNVLYNHYTNNFWSDVDGKPQPKYSTIHYLGFSTSKFQVGLFDEVLWLGKDTNFTRGFDVQYLNPLIFIRPLEFTIGSPDNAMIGFNLKYKIYKKGFIYGQLALDDLNFKEALDNHKLSYGDKYALQLGIWNKDIFNVKNLSWRLEWNGVRPYVYGHGVGGQIALNYTHYYQSLTDPFGANYHEFISLFNYEKERWYATLENLYTIRGENPGLSYNNGEDLFGGEAGVPREGSKTLQGIHTNYSFNQFTAGYLLNPANRLSIEINVAYRSRNSAIVNQSDWLFGIGIKTNLYNFYHDF